MSDSIHLRSKLAKYILDQWLMLDRSIMPATEMYKCNKCFALELGMCPEELVGMNMNCRPDHKNGIQAYLAVDATPLQGGIAFYALGTCFYYQPNFNELGIYINRMRPTDFEMVNLLLALFIFKDEILNHRTVRIIVDNNYLRKKGKLQRHALTEAIAAILQWCDNFGCTINEIFEGNTSEDKPFIVIADKLSRNYEIRQSIMQMKQTNLSKSWENVVFVDYREIPSFKRRCLNEMLLALINKILLQPKMYGPTYFEQDPFVPEYYVPKSYAVYECPRFRRMKLYFEDEPIEFLPPQPLFNIPAPKRSNEPKGSWMKTFLISTTIFFIFYLAVKNRKL